MTCVSGPERRGGKRYCGVPALVRGPALSAAHIPAEPQRQRDELLRVALTRSPRIYRPRDGDRLVIERAARARRLSWLVGFGVAVR